MAEQIKIFDFNFGNTIENIARLKAELKETKKAFEQAPAGSEQFNKLGVNVKALESQIKTLNAVTKENTNALGGINTATKFAAGSYGELKQRIDAQRKSLLELTVDSEEFNATQQGLIKLQEQRIAIEAKIPSLFQERIKGAIDESNSLKQLRIDLKNAQAAALNGDGAAAKRVAELKDQIDDLKDSTQSLQGSGVERLNTSMNLLTEGFQNFDADKIKTGFKGIGAAMSAIPIILIIEGIKLLIENFDEVVKFAKTLTGSFSAAEQQVKDLTIATERETVANKGLINAYTNEIALLTAKGGHEREIIELKKKKIAVEIAEAENSVRLNAAKVAEAVLNNSITDSVNNLTVALFRKVGATETADKLEEIQSKVRKARILEEQKDNIKAIEDAKLAIAKSKNELLVIDAEANKKQIDNAKEKNKTIADLEKDRQAREADVENALIDREEKRQKDSIQRQKDAAAMLPDLEKQLLDNLSKLDEQYYNDKIARAQTELTNNYINDGNILTQQLNLLEAKREQELSNTELTMAERNEIIAKYDREAYELSLQYTQKQFDDAVTYTDSVGALSDALFTIKRNNLEKGSEADKEAARQQFEVNKAVSIATAILNGASAVMNALGTVQPYYLAIAAAVSAGATTAAQVAKIEATPFQYYEGGYTGEGNPHDVSTNLGKRDYTYHKDEYIVPSKVLNTPEGIYHTTRLEAMRKGVTKTNIAGFYDGGYTTRQAGANAMSSTELINGVVSVMSAQPAPIVRVTDINNVSKSAALAVSVSDL